ncbi:FAD-dependent oxidoreductase, partial [bacterium]|nr:FAD-dependent oxidoreductase [bacterium]
AVYTFCMCPGGKIVPATAFPERNIVNGMSLYARDGQFANSAVVATIRPEDINPHISAEGMMEYLDRVEQSAFKATGGYDAPANTIAAFLESKIASSLSKSSYPFSLIPSDFDALLPHKISSRIREALVDFNHKVPGFSSGNIIGLETKTSSSIQVTRTKSGSIEGFPNLFVCGEGSGWSGGIVSSAADGIRAALALLNS